MTIFATIASAQLSLLVGLIVVAALLLLKRHRDRHGKLDSSKIIAGFLFSIALYTMLICAIGQFFLGIPVSVSIHSYFGDSRIAWLFVGLAADLFARLYLLFDPDLNHSNTSRNQIATNANN